MFDFTLTEESSATAPSGGLYDVIIIGGGPAGMTTAIYASRDGMKVLVLERESTGGLAATTERIAELIETDLEAVGIDVDLKVMESKTVDSKVGEWDFDLALSGHGGIIGDPNFLAEETIDMEDFNSARFDDDPELTSLLEEQVTETDEDARHDLIDRAQVLYAEDVPALTLFYTESFVAHDGQVDLYYTYNGMALGIPIALNKLSFVGV